MNRGTGLLLAHRDCFEGKVDLRKVGRSFDAVVPVAADRVGRLGLEIGARALLVEDQSHLVTHVVKVRQHLKAPASPTLVSGGAI